MIRDKNLHEQPTETDKLHYKMYKAGKMWLFAGITTVSFGLTMVGNLKPAKADTTGTGTDSTGKTTTSAGTSKNATIEADQPASAAPVKAAAQSAAPTTSAAASTAPATSAAKANTSTAPANNSTANTTSSVAPKANPSATSTTNSVAPKTNPSTATNSSSTATSSSVAQSSAAKGTTANDSTAATKAETVTSSSSTATSDSSKKVASDASAKTSKRATNYDFAVTDSTSTTNAGGQTAITSTSDVISASNLKDAITATKGLDESQYAFSSFSALQAVLTAATTTLNDTKATDAQKTAALTDLQNSVKTLSKPTSDDPAGVNYDQFAKYLNDTARKVVGSSYTVASYQHLQGIIDNATKVDSSSASALVNVSYQQLQDAIAALVPTSGDERTALANTVTSGNALQSSDYTTDSWTAYQTALVAANNALSDGSTTNDQFANHNKSLLDAAAALTPASKTDLTASLNTAINAAQAALTQQAASQLYSVGSATDLKNAVLNAQALGTSATPDQLAAAVANINAATTGLIPASSLSQLNTDYNQANSIVSAVTNAGPTSMYTSSSWSAFANAITNAQAVLRAPSATNDDRANADYQLKQAMTNLMSSTRVKAKLDYDSALGNALGLQVWTAESIKRLNDAITAAGALNNPTPDQIEQADLAITNAIGRLVTPTDKSLSDAQKYLKAAGVLKDTDYTADSWQNLKDAITDTQSTLSNSTINATIVSAAANRLRKAIWNLVFTDTARQTAHAALVTATKNGDGVYGTVMGDSTDKALVASDYTYGYSQVMQSVAAAEKLLDAGNATTQDMNSAVNTIAFNRANLQTGQGGGISGNVIVNRMTLSNNTTIFSTAGGLFEVTAGSSITGVSVNTNFTATWTMPKAMLQFFEDANWQKYFKLGYAVTTGLAGYGGFASGQTGLLGGKPDPAADKHALPAAQIDSKQIRFTMNTSTGLPVLTVVTQPISTGTNGNINFDWYLQFDLAQWSKDNLAAGVSAYIPVLNAASTTDDTSKGQAENEQVISPLGSGSYSGNKIIYSIVPNGVNLSGTLAIGSGWMQNEYKDQSSSSVTNLDGTKYDYSAGPTNTTTGLGGMSAARQAPVGVVDASALSNVTVGTNTVTGKITKNYVKNADGTNVNTDLADDQYQIVFQVKHADGVTETLNANHPTIVNSDGSFTFNYAVEDSVGNLTGKSFQAGDTVYATVERSNATYGFLSVGNRTQLVDKVLQAKAPTVTFATPHANDKVISGHITSLIAVGVSNGSAANSPTPDQSDLNNYTVSLTYYAPGQDTGVSLGEAQVDNKTGNFQQAVNVALQPGGRIEGTTYVYNGFKPISGSLQRSGIQITDLSINPTTITIGTNKDALKTSIDTATNRQAEPANTYSTDSLSNLNGMLAAANKVYADGASSQDSVNKATNNLNSAIVGLVRTDGTQTVDKTILENAIKSVPTTQGKYTDTTWGNLTTALTAAKTVDGDEKATVEQVTKATSDLNDAIAGLAQTATNPSNPSQVSADLTNLNKAVTDAQTKLTSGTHYTADSLTNLTNALAVASTLGLSPSQTQVNAATDAVTVATSGLTKSAENDSAQADLNNAVQKAAAALSDVNSYTPSTVTALQTAVKAANALTNPTEADQTAATKAITDAITNLKAAPDLTALNTAIANATGKLNGAESYTTDTLTPMQTALKAAQAITGDSSATDITAATTALNNAVSALKTTPSRTDLNAALGKAADKMSDGTIYSADSVAALQKVIKDAQGLAADADPTAATTAITAAIAGMTAVDHSGLTAAVTNAQTKLNAGNLTTDSAKALTDALVAATKLAANADPTAVIASLKSATDNATVALDRTALNSAVAAAADKLSNGKTYTPTTVAAVKAAMATAAGLTGTLTQTAIDNAATALNKAVDGLAEQTTTAVDRTKLTAALTAAQTALSNGTNYTADSTSALIQALNTAAKIDATSDQVAVDAATDALTKATTGLVTDTNTTVTPAQKTLTDTTAKAITALGDTANDTPASVKQLTDALAAAAKATTDEDAKTASAALQKAIDGLTPAANRDDLDAAIQAAEAKLTGQTYTPETLAAATKALADAKALTGDSTQPEVNAAKTALTNATAGLKTPTAPVDRTSLNNSLAKAATQLSDGKNYTPASIKAVQDAVTKAQNATDQASVTTAQTELDKAIAGLTEQTPVDRTDLNKAVTDALSNALTKQYTPETAKAVTDALAAAAALGSDATQQDIADKTAALNNAISALQPATAVQLNWSVLQTAVNLASSLLEHDGNKYTADSIATLKKAIGTAQALLDRVAKTSKATNLNAMVLDFLTVDPSESTADDTTSTNAADTSATDSSSPVTQADIDDAINALNNAISGLQPATGTPSDGSSTGTSTGTPSNGSSTGTSTGTPSNGSSTGTSTGTPSNGSSTGTSTGTPSNGSSTGTSTGTPSNGSSTGTSTGTPSNGSSTGTSTGTPSNGGSTGTSTGTPSNGSSTGTSTGTPSNGSSTGTSTGTPSNGSSTGTSTGTPSNGSSTGTSTGTPSNGSSTGTSTGTPSNGSSTGTSTGTPSNGSSTGTSTGTPSNGSSTGTSTGTPSNGSSTGTSTGTPSNGSSTGTSTGTPSNGSSTGTSTGTPSNGSSTGTSTGTPSNGSSTGTSTGTPSNGSSTGTSTGTPSNGSSTGTSTGTPSNGSSTGTSTGTPSNGSSTGTSTGTPSNGSSAGTPTATKDPTGTTTTNSVGSNGQTAEEHQTSDGGQTAITTTPGKGSEQGTSQGTTQQQTSAGSTGSSVNNSQPTNSNSNQQTSGGANSEVNQNPNGGATTTTNTKPGTDPNTVTNQGGGATTATSTNPANGTTSTGNTLPDGTGQTTSQTPAGITDTTTKNPSTGTTTNTSTQPGKGATTVTNPQGNASDGTTTATSTGTNGKPETATSTGNTGSGTATTGKTNGQGGSTVATTNPTTGAGSTTTTDATGKQTTQTSDGSGKSTTTATDPSTGATQTGTSDGQGNSTITTHNVNGTATTGTKDKNGATSTTTKDPSNGKTSSTFTDPKTGGQTVVTTDPKTGAVTVSDGAGNPVTGQTNGTTTTYPNGVTVTKNPDGSSTVTGNGTTIVTDGKGDSTVTGPDGSTTKLNHDGSVAVTGPDKSQITTDTNGKTTIQDPNGAETVQDPKAGTTVTSPDGQTQTQQTTDGVITTTTKNPDGSTTVTKQQQDGKVDTTTTNPDGTKDVTVSQPDGSSTTTHYDAAGAAVATKATDAKGSTTTTTKNPNGSTTATTQVPGGDTTVATKNADGTVDTTVQHQDGTVDFTHTDAQGKATLTSHTATDGTKTTTTVNSDGSTTKTTQVPNGAVTTQTTHRDGSVDTTVQQPDGVVDYTHADAAGHVTTSTHTATNGAKTTTVKNADGSTTTTVQNPDGTKTTTVKNADGSSLTTDYDPQGQAVAGKQHYADGTDVSYTKEPDGSTNVTAHDAKGQTIGTATLKNGNTATVAGVPVTVDKAGQVSFGTPKNGTGAAKATENAGGTTSTGTTVGNGSTGGTNSSVGSNSGTPTTSGTDTLPGGSNGSTGTATGTTNPGGTSTTTPRTNSQPAVLTGTQNPGTVNENGGRQAATNQSQSDVTNPTDATKQAAVTSPTNAVAQSTEQSKAADQNSMTLPQTDENNGNLMGLLGIASLTAGSAMFFGLKRKHDQDEATKY